MASVTGAQSEGQRGRVGRVDRVGSDGACRPC